MTNTYKPGQVWEDSDGDRWTVTKIGVFQDWFGESAFPYYVEDHYGPLTLIEEGNSVNSEAYGTNQFVTSVPDELAERVSNLNGGLSYLYQAFKTYDDAFQLLVRKSADYGPRNIADSPGGALNGLRVRMWDKMARIRNLTETGADPQNESVRDSFLDMLNYSAIALMVIDGNWPGVETDK